MLENLRSSIQQFLPTWIQKHKKILGLIFLGTFIRIVVSFYTSHPNDEEVWYITAVNMLSGHGSPYGTWYFAYPPVWAYIYLPFVSVGSLFSNPYLFYARINMSGTVAPVMSPLFNFVVKLPIIMGDIFVGLIIYQLVSDFRDEQAAKDAFIFWFFNPFVIFTGAVIAQFDVLPALTSLLTLAFFIQRKYLLAGVSLGIAIMAKIYPVYFIPLYITFLFKPDSSKKIKWKKGILWSIHLLAGILLTVALSLLPILAFNSFPYFFELIFRRGDYITTIGGLTPMTLVYFFGDAIEWINDNSRLSIIYAILSILQIIGITLVSFHYAFRSKQEKRLRSFLRGHVCILTIIYLTIFTVNPQHIIWVMPFLIVGYGLYGNYKIRLSLLSISACFLAFYWAYPFYPVIIHVNKEIGMMLINTLNLASSPIGYPLAMLFGLLGAISIILLPFPVPRISKLKVLLTRRKCEENFTE